jgi:hypothetical protein
MGMLYTAIDITASGDPEGAGPVGRGVGWEAGGGRGRGRGDLRLAMLLAKEASLLELATKLVGTGR